MIRPILSLVFSLVLAALGYQTLFAGGIELFVQSTRFGPSGSFPIGPLMLVVLGVLLLVAAMLTVAISPVGVLVLGGIHLVFGLAVIALPFDPLGGFVSPAMSLIQLLMDVNRTFSDGLYFSVPTGIGMLAGAAFVAVGLARPVIATSRWLRFAAGAAGLISGAAGLVLALTGGSMIYTAMLRYLTGEVAVLGLGLVLAGTVLFGVAVFAARWSAIGILVLGAVVTVLGFVSVGAPAALPIATRPVSMELSVALQYAGPTGNLALLGMLLLAAGGGVLLSRRLRPAAQASV